MKPLEFSPERVLKSIRSLGYAHILPSTPRSILDPFLEEHGLMLCEPACYTVTIRLGEPVAESVEDRAAKWENIRQERNAAKLKKAVAKKEKEAKK